MFFRLKSDTPCCFSKFLINWLKADCETNRFSAATVKLPFDFTISTKYCIWLMSIFIGPFTFLLANSLTYQAISLETEDFFLLRKQLLPRGDLQLRKLHAYISLLICYSLKPLDIVDHTKLPFDKL